MTYVVPLAEIDKVDNGFSGKEEERIDDLNLTTCKQRLANAVLKIKANLCVIIRKGRHFRMARRYGAIRELGL